MSILIPLLTIVEVLICLLLILIIMMQRPRQEGLGASFGSGVMDQIAGVQTTNVLQKGTSWLAGAMFVTTILLASLVAKEHKKSDTQIFEAPKAEAAAAKPTDAKDAKPADAAKPAAATNGPALKLTPGGGAVTSPVINVQPPGATATKLPNGAGTVVVKPGNAKPAEGAKPAATPEAKPTPAPEAKPAAAPAGDSKPATAPAAPATK